MSLSITKQHDGSHWLFEGTLDADDVGRNQELLSSGRPTNGAWIVDIGGLTHINSAGVAYLLSAIRYADKHNLELKIEAMPQLVIELMKLQGVYDIISAYVKGA